MRFAQAPPRVQRPGQLSAEGARGSTFSTPPAAPVGPPRRLPGHLDAPVRTPSPPRRHRAVAELHDAVERGRPVAANDDGRVRLLQRLRIGPDLVEADKLAVKLGLALGPDLLHGEHALAEQSPARLPLRAVVLHLLGVPAAADAEEEATARQPVEGGDLLGRGDRVALDDEADAGAELQAPGRRGRRHERDEGVVGRPVVSREGAPARPGAAPARGDVRVLREPHRLEAALLERPGELVGGNRVLGRKHDDAVVHESPLGLARPRPGTIGDTPERPWPPAGPEARPTPPPARRLEARRPALGTPVPDSPPHAGQPNCRTRTVSTSPGAFDPYLTLPGAGAASQAAAGRGPDARRRRRPRPERGLPWPTPSLIGGEPPIADATGCLYHPRRGHRLGEEASWRSGRIRSIRCSASRSSASTSGASTRRPSPTSSRPSTSIRCSSSAGSRSATRSRSPSAGVSGRSRRRSARSSRKRATLRRSPAWRTSTPRTA